MRYFLICLTFIFYCSSADASGPDSFKRAKKEMQLIYQDYPLTFYCGCRIAWSGKSSAKPDLDTCGYKVRKSPTRAHLVEWEHVVPAHTFGQQRPCWRKGGRRNCIASDPVFRQMEADMFNLVPAIGEVNGDRSNFRFGVLPATPSQHGQCPVKIDFQQRIIEPRPEVRGEIARINFYMYDRYGLRMSRQQQQLFLAWHKQYPVSEWEKIRNDRIAQKMGHSNLYIRGERLWTLGYESVDAPDNLSSTSIGKGQANSISATTTINLIKGNINSKVYHLPEGCPSYHEIKPKNIQYFTGERDALAKGYRKAGNCK